VIAESAAVAFCNPVLARSTRGVPGCGVTEPRPASECVIHRSAFVSGRCSAHRRFRFLLRNPGCLAARRGVSTVRGLSIAADPSARRPRPCAQQPQRRQRRRRRRHLHRRPVERSARQDLDPARQRQSSAGHRHLRSLERDVLTPASPGSSRRDPACAGGFFVCAGQPGTAAADACRVASAARRPSGQAESSMKPVTFLICDGRHKFSFRNHDPVA